MACSCQKNNGVNALPPTKDEIVSFVKDVALTTGGFIGGQMLRSKVEFIKEKALVSGGLKAGLAVGAAFATDMPELKSLGVGLFMSGLYDLSEAVDGKKGGTIQKNWGIGELDYTPRYQPYNGISDDYSYSDDMQNNAVVE
jgi:hypothetical protein